MRCARRLGRVLGLVLLSLAFAPAARAHDVVVAHTHDQEQEGPSIFEYGWQGLFSGALVGLGGGYLVGRRDGWEKSDWRAIGLGVSIGALAGAGLGISLGLLDRGGVSTGRYIARDLSAGSGFGLVIGAVSGGISAALQSEPEHVLFGGAIGVIAGAGLGIVAGIVEGALHEDDATTTVRRRLRLSPSLAWTRTTDGSAVWLPGLRSQF